MKNASHSAWHVTGMKTHQLESRMATLTSILTMSLAKPLLTGSLCKEEEVAQSNFWPWSTKLVTESEYKAGLF